MRPFEGLGEDHPLREPYHVQMAAAFLLREFVFDLAEHLARVRSPQASCLDRRLKRYLGLGNSAGQGLIPFIANHPHVMHRWCLTQETARAEAAARPVTPDTLGRFQKLLDKAIRYYTEDPRDGNGIFLDYADLARQLGVARERIARRQVLATWETVVLEAQACLHAEVGECLGTILLEAHPDIVMKYENGFRAEETFDVKPEMLASELRSLVGEAYAWALDGRLPRDQWTENFWYQPVEAPDEPRRGRRGVAPTYEFESRMDVPRQVAALDDALAEALPVATVADVLAAHPGLRHIVRRVQSVAALAYAELRDSTISADYTPFAAERFLLAFYGMEKLDPRPPRSVKGAFLQGAPTAADIAEGIPGEWPFPLIPDVSTVKAQGIKRAPLRLLESPELLPSAIRKLGVRQVDRRESGESLPFFSVEYQKLTIRAGLVAGLPLGLAEVLTELGELTDALEPGRGIGELLSLFSGLQGRRYKCPNFQQRGSVLQVNVHGDPGLVHVPTVVDLVHSKAVRGSEASAVAIIDDGRGGALLPAAAFKGARRGVGTLIGWRSASGRGMALSIPIPDYPLLATAEGWPEDVVRSAPSAVSDALSAAAADNIVVACVIDPLAWERIRSAADGKAWRTSAANRIEAAIARTRTDGFAMTAEQFARLEALAKRWLVPDAVEPTVALHASPRS
jgi:hypothetical protein